MLCVRDACYPPYLPVLQRMIDEVPPLEFSGGEEDTICDRRRAMNRLGAAIDTVYI